ncbi:hypothetical protein MKW98_016302 [Papaver atlanticum]|uniref:Uncharacterized protein n=1 Tax=Papaver atlanticum TaxID=357466 RepID=A0AAD4SH61_9MAGN|nr:hypothetical protein MKW98_016302 [Papaver atlanticum]
MLQAAAECLAAYILQRKRFSMGRFFLVFPAVVKEAIEEALAEGYRDMDAREPKTKSGGNFTVCSEQYFEFSIPNYGIQKGLKILHLSLSLLVAMVVSLSSCVKEELW